MKSFKFSRHFLISLFFLTFNCFCIFADSHSKEDAKKMRNSFIAEVTSHLGSTYKLGAVGPSEFDCSGLVYYSAQQSLEISLPRTAQALYDNLEKVSDSRIEPGDLLFFITKGFSVSHVGVYIGNDQFISALSDGESKVVARSCSNSYWKSKYCGARKFLPAAEDFYDDGNYFSPDYEIASNEKPKFVDRFFFDVTFSGDWSLFTENSFIPNFRGLTAGSNIFYNAKDISIGLGFQAKWNNASSVFQIPVLFSILIGKYFQIYAGPVLTFGELHQVHSDEKMLSSVFPGIIAFQIKTPSFGWKKLKFQVYQDFSYTVYNNTDGAALSFSKSMANGFVLNSGIKVLFPFSTFVR